MSTYSRFIVVPSSENFKRVFLRVKAAQTVADVYLDNHFVAQHKGGYTSFTVELTHLIRKGEKHKLDIRVSNAQTMEIAPICGDFNIWGGLNRGVELLYPDLLNKTRSQHVLPDDQSLYHLFSERQLRYINMDY
jgi:beta-galactosidase